MRHSLLSASLSLTLAPIAFAQQPPTRTLSKPQVEFAEPFTDIGSVRELSDGRVIAVDARELNVKLIDFRAGTATVIGRNGQGPGEYQWPRLLFALPGDSTLLQDAAGNRLMIIQPDGKPGGFFDPAEIETDSGLARIRQFHVRFANGSRYLFGQAQPIRIGANGTPELTDHYAIERLDFYTKKRDTVALVPLRKDPSRRVIAGAGVVSSPSMAAWPVWEHWLVAPSGRITFVEPDPYRVNNLGTDGSVTEHSPIPYERVRVNDALKKEHEKERSAPSMAMRYNRGGGSTMELMRRPYTPPKEWPDFLPPYKGTGTYAPDGMLWIQRMTAAGRPPLYDIIDAGGKLFERVELPARTKLVGFGASSLYLVRLDEDDLQYLQRYTLPTTARP